MNDFLHHYTEILTDPAHLAVEVSMMIIVDGLLLGLIWPLIKRFIDHRLEREHRMLDAEHGIEHHQDHVHHAPSPLADDDCPVQPVESVETGETGPTPGGTS